MDHDALGGAALGSVGGLDVSVAKVLVGRAV
jgi:hypothetical protein